MPSHRNTVEISQKVTKRPYMKIMEKIRGKIADRLREKFGPEEGDKILEALREQHIEHQIILLLRQDRIQLLNQHNQPIYTTQIKDILDYHAQGGDRLPRGQAYLIGPTDLTYNDGSDNDQHHQQHPGSPTSASQVSRSKLVSLN